MKSVLKSLALFALLATTISQKSYNFQQEDCKVDKSTNFKPQYKNLDDKCFIKTDPGMCRAAVPSYHFDPSKGKCVKSLHGGCDDGCYAFSTMQECQGLCVKNKIQPVTGSKPKEQKSEDSCKVDKPKNLSAELKKLDDRCFIKTESGMCRAAFPSYHFDPLKGKCVEDVYGGCSDGCSVFGSIEECERSCVKKSSQPAKKEESKTNGSFSQQSCKVEIPNVIFNPLVKFDKKCYIKTNSGMCRAAFPSYHFDPLKGKCVEDVYGGCDDGCLAFTSIEECNSTCRTR